MSLGQTILTAKLLIAESLVLVHCYAFIDVLHCKVLPLIRSHLIKTLTRQVCRLSFSRGSGDLICRKG